MDMEIEMNGNGKLKIGMQEYIKTYIDMSDEDVLKPVASEACGKWNKIKNITSERTIIGHVSLNFG